MSAATKPPEVYLMANEAGAKMTQVTTSTSDTWRSHKWVDGTLLTFAARDGAQVYARLYTPEMIGAKRHPSASAGWSCRQRSASVATVARRRTSLRPPG